MADVFKFTEDQQTALKLIVGTVRTLLLFGGSPWQDADSDILHHAATAKRHLP